MKFICMFLPGLIGVQQEKKEKEIIKLIFIYANYVLATNLLVLLVIAILGRGGSYIESSDSVIFYIFYIVVASIGAYFLPKAKKYFKKNFNLKIKRESK